MKQDKRLLTPEEIEALPLGEQGEHRKPTIGSWWKGNCELFDVIKKAQDAKTLREVETLFADNSGVITFIRKRDGKAGVENCNLIITKEWQALKQLPEGG